MLKFAHGMGSKVLCRLLVIIALFSRSLAVSVFHVYAECTQATLKSGCERTCAARPDTVALVFHTVLPCSWLYNGFVNTHDSSFCSNVSVPDHLVSNKTIPFFLQTMEPLAVLPYYADPKVMSRMTACVGYHRSCAFYYPFIGDIQSGFDMRGRIENLEQQLRFPAQNLVALKRGFNSATLLRIRRLQKADIFYMSSHTNTPSNRGDYVAALMQHIPIDSWGRELNNINANFMSDHRKNLSQGGLDKMMIMSHYKFVLAFENSICEDYVTEKLWGALYVGVVPIVFAHDSIYDFLPSSRAVINAKNFRSVTHLANYLQRIASNPREYRRHTIWREKPFHKKFRSYISNVHAAYKTDFWNVLCDHNNGVGQFRKPSFGSCSAA